MLSPYITKYKGIKDIEKNIEFYFNKFKEDSVLCFRDANVDKAEQLKIFNIFGDFFGWIPNKKSFLDKDIAEAFDKVGYSQDNHARYWTEENLKHQDTGIIAWHNEHFWRTSRTVASIWNMKIFTCSEEKGKTWFVDTKVVWDMLNQKDQEFLKKCTSFAYDLGNKYVTTPVTRHWKFGYEMLQFDFAIGDGKEYIDTFNNRKPTFEEINNFNRILLFAKYQVKNNLDIRIVHKWKQGDILIPDLFKLAHTVTGGFRPEERYFECIWGFQPERFNNYSQDHGIINHYEK